MDEPYINALSVGKSAEEMKDELNQVNFLIKKTFPSVKTVGCLGNPEEFGYPTWDVVGFDFYYASERERMSLEEFKNRWLEKFDRLNEFLLPGQEIVLVPGVFHHRDRAPSTEEFLDLADFYSEAANSNPKVTVVAPFLWETVGDLIGMRDLPTEVLSEWQDIGRSIIEASQLNEKFRFSTNGPIPGMYCVPIIEMADPYWNAPPYNCFCSDIDYGIQWSMAGPISGMRCVQITETANPTWTDDNFCAHRLIVRSILLGIALDNRQEIMLSDG